MMAEMMQTDTKATGGQLGAGYAAELSRAIMAVCEAHVSALQDWDGKAAAAAQEAFARFDAELERYETMLERLAKSYRESGDEDAG